MALMQTGIVVTLEDHTGKGVRTVSFNLDKLQKKAGKVGKKTAKNLKGPITSAFNSISKFAKNSFYLMETFGRVGRMVFRGMAGPIVDATKASLDFGKKMAEINTLLVDDAVKGSAENMARLKNEVLEMSREFGQMPIDQTKALYQIISAGALEGTDAINTLRAANTLAVGGLSDTASAASAIATIVNAFNITFGSANHIADLFFKTVQKGVTTVPLLTKKIGLVAGSAGSAGMSLESLFSLIAVGTKALGNTSYTITGLNMAIMSLRAPGKTAQEEFKRLGIKFGDVAVAGDKFIETITKIAARTDISSRTMKILFPQIRALRFIFASTADGGDKLNDMLEKFKTKTKGAAKAAFKLVEATAGFQLDRVVAAFESVKILFGDLVVSSAGLGSVFKGMAEGLSLVSEALETVFFSGKGIGQTAEQLESLGKGLVYFATDASIQAIKVIGVLAKAVTGLGVTAAQVSKLLPLSMLVDEDVPTALIDSLGVAATAHTTLSDSAAHGATSFRRLTAAFTQGGKATAIVITAQDAWNDKVLLTNVLNKEYEANITKTKKALYQLGHAKKWVTEKLAKMTEGQKKLTAEERRWGPLVKQREKLISAIAILEKEERNLTVVHGHQGKVLGLVKKRVKELGAVERHRNDALGAAITLHGQASDAVAELNRQLVLLRIEMAKAQDPVAIKALQEQITKLDKQAKEVREAEIQRKKKEAARAAAADARRAARARERSEAAKEQEIRKHADFFGIRIRYLDQMAKKDDEYARGTVKRDDTMRDFKVERLEGLSRKEKKFVEAGFRLAKKRDSDTRGRAKRLAKEREAARKKTYMADERNYLADVTNAEASSRAKLAELDKFVTAKRMTQTRADIELAKFQQTQINNVESHRRIAIRKGQALAAENYATIAENEEDAFNKSTAAQMKVIAAARRMYAEKLRLIKATATSEIEIELLKEKAILDIVQELTKEGKDYKARMAERGIAIAAKDEKNSEKAGKKLLADQKKKANEIEQFAAQTASTIVSLGSGFVTDLLDDQKTVKEAFKSLGLTILEMLGTTLAEYILTEGIKMALTVTTTSVQITADAARVTSSALSAAQIIAQEKAIQAAKMSTALLGAGGLLGLGILGLAIGGLAYGITSAFSEDAEADYISSRGIGKPLASGGLVTGGTPGRDSVAAMLMPGEFVLPKYTVDAIRGGTPPSRPGRFAAGGFVGAAAAVAGIQQIVFAPVFAPNIQTIALPTSVQNQRYYRDTVLKTRNKLAKSGRTT